MLEDTLFPEFEDDDDIEEFALDDDIDEDEESQPPLPYGFTWRFDHNAGDIFLSPRGEAVKVYTTETVIEWIQHTLAVKRFETPIYGTAVGTDIHDLLGLKANDQYVLSRIRSEIEEAISEHDRVIAVEVAEIFPLEDAIYAYVTFETDDGLVEETLLTL